MAQHPHLFVPTAGEAARFTSPNSGPREGISLPVRDRADHANNLIAKLEALAPEAAQRVETQKVSGLDQGFGIYLTFQSEPDFSLKFESLDLTRSGIELCSVKTNPDHTMQAAVFVPDGKLDLFLNRIVAYRDENTTPRQEGGPTRPKNQDLVESISDIKIAALEALWTEERVPFPDRTAITTWELWLRRQGTTDHLARLHAFAGQFNLIAGAQSVAFVDRTVVLVRGSGDDLARSIDILGMIAEVRMPEGNSGLLH
jgi:hypothetical protein